MSRAGRRGGGRSQATARAAAGPAAGGPGSEAARPETAVGAAGEIQLPHRIVVLTALTLVAVVLLSDGYLVAGPAGFVAAGTVLALVAMLAVRATVAAGDEPASGAVRDDHRSGQSSQADFPAYREITSDLYWAGSSRRHYDHGLRSRLARLLDARLAQRHGMDAATHPERARELVGAELWPLVDASQPASNDSHAPGVSLGTLARIVSRLEEL